MLSDIAGEQVGAVDILVNNDRMGARHRYPVKRRPPGRSLQPVTAATWEQQCRVDAMAAALLISEFARRHIARGAG
jgi:3-oxoacyl-[acyl-carrier protein] reductase